MLESALCELTSLHTHFSSIYWLDICVYCFEFSLCHLQCPFLERKLSV